MADAGVGETAAVESAKAASEVAAAETAGAAAVGETAAGASLASGLGASTAAGLDAFGAATGAEALGAGAGSAFAGEAAGASLASGLGASTAAGLDAFGAEAGTTAFGSVPSAFAGESAAAGAAGAGGASFLPVGGGVSSLSPELATSLGIDPALAGGASILPSSAVPAATEAAGGAGFFGDAASSIGSWLSKNPGQAAMLGLSGINALSTPKLPSAANKALDNASGMTQQAQETIASGGMSSPAWGSQKASIDQNINQQLTNAIAQLKQSAINNGMGGANSAVVQQQINDLHQKAETQRQQLYSQALSQIVSQSVSELTGGNQTLSSIAQMQLGQSSEAKQSASQTAQLALMLGQLSKSPATGA